MAIVAIFTVALTFFATATAELRIVEAGGSGREGPALVDGFLFCPTDFSAEGFSIDCRINGATTASFYEGNVLKRKENVAPFLRNGNSATEAYAWNDYPTAETTIRCVGNNGVEFSARGKFECVPATPLTPAVQQKAPKPESVQRSVDNDMLVGVNQNYCVTKKGTGHVGALEPGWEKIGSAVWYKPNDNFEGVVGSNTAVLEYFVTVPVKSVYAFTLDMTTSHWTEHNDVWVKIDTGFILRKPGTVGPQGKKFFKAYHNDNGRAKKANSVDFDAHQFSTQVPLVPGTTYKVSIGARSTKTGINGFIMFPCEGATCVSSSPHWKDYLMLCNV